jgi:hypothetical protein
MTPNDSDFDQVWDEHRWEQHLKAFETESNRLRQFIDATWGETRPSWERLLNEFPTKSEVVDAYVEEELMFEESAFPDDDDDFGDDEDEDFDDDFFVRGQQDTPSSEAGLPLFDSDAEDDDDDDEEALQSAEDELAAVLDLLEEEPEMEFFNRSRAISAEVLAWREQLGEVQLTPEMSGFIQDVLQTTAKLAAAYWFGYDSDLIGANIAYSKKALGCTNRAIERLRSLYLNGIISETTYRDFTSRLHELRNDLGIKIQEMRDQFNEAQ